MRVCRYHGAKRPEAVRRGGTHGRYKTGDFTQVVKVAYRQGAARLTELEGMAFRMGLMAGKRTPGRKPGG